MSQQNVILVGGTKMVERHLRAGLPEGASLIVLKTMAQAMRRMGHETIHALVLGPTMRRALAMVTTLRRDSEHKDCKLVVVYRDDHRNDVKRHLKGRFKADEYVMQSKASKELAAAMVNVLRLAEEPRVNTEFLAELPLDALEVSADVSEDAQAAPVGVDVVPASAGDRSEQATEMMDVIDSLNAERTPAGGAGEVLGPFGALPAALPDGGPDEQPVVPDDAASDELLEELEELEDISAELDVLKPELARPDEGIGEEGIGEEGIGEEGIGEEGIGEEGIGEEELGSLEVLGSEEVEMLDSGDLETLGDDEVLEIASDELEVIAEGDEQAAEAEPETRGTGATDAQDVADVQRIGLQEFAGAEIEGEEIEDLEEVELIEDLDSDLLEEASVEVSEQAAAAVEASIGALEDDTPLTGALEVEAAPPAVEQTAVPPAVEQEAVPPAVEETLPPALRQETAPPAVKETAPPAVKETAAVVVEVAEEATATAPVRKKAIARMPAAERATVRPPGRKRHTSAAFMASGLDELTELIANLKESASEISRLEFENEELRDRVEQVDPEVAVERENELQEARRAAEVAARAATAADAARAELAAEVRTLKARVAETEALEARVAEIEALEARVAELEAAEKNRLEVVAKALGNLREVSGALAALAE